MKTTVILIDDDIITNTLHRIVLKKINSELTYKIFEDATKALEFIHELDSELPRIIFLDINMPIMNGWEFMEEYCNTTECKIPVLIVTSSIEENDKIKAAKFNSVIGFVHKPLEKSNLPKEVLELLT